ncbi:MAG TPA: ABC transporter permease [Candidatus Methylomirabilis sp.]|nr:ABC transporter permease [Candidatus Methylomirabilis sp.]
MPSPREVMDALPAEDARLLPTPAAVRAPRPGLLPLLLLGPAVAWTFLFFLLPLAVMVWQSVQHDGLSLFHYRKLLSTPLYLSAIMTTFQISLGVTAGSLLLGYPVAYVIATAGPRVRGLVLLLVVIPYWLDYIVRSYSWMVLLGRMGLVNRSLIEIGLISEPLSLLYSIWSVNIGMIQILLPLMVLTLYGAMHGIDQRLVQAAAIHGAGPWQAFRRVFFPLSLPGVYGASLLTFVVSMGFYITPALLGGRKQTMISQLIYTLASDMLDWPLASAASVLLLILSLAIVLVYNRLFSIDRLWGGATS